MREEADAEVARRTAESSRLRLIVDKESECQLRRGGIIL